MTVVERLRKMDPKAYRFQIVGADGEPITRNAYGKATRSAFASRAAAETNLRGIRRYRPDARIDGR